GIGMRAAQDRLFECSLLETAIGFSSWTPAQWLADHEEPTRQGSRHTQNAPYQRMQTKDGYLMGGAAGEGNLGRFAKALEHPEWWRRPIVLQPVSDQRHPPFGCAADRIRGRLRGPVRGRKKVSVALPAPSDIFDMQIHTEAYHIRRACTNK